MRLAKDRGIKSSTLRAWNVGWDGKQYTIPVNACGKTYDLRRYQIGGKTLGTTGSNVSLVGQVEPSSDTIWLTEGEWDGMALWEALQHKEQFDTVLSMTGATSFPKHAVSVFAGKDVNVIFDNDSTGEKGCLRVEKMIGDVARKINYVHWPKAFPDKFDLRDLYMEKKHKTISIIRKLFNPRPPGAIENANEVLPELDGEGMDSEEVTRRWRKWMDLPDVECLSVLYGTVFANRLDGDPVWLFLVGPPGCGKSELLMSLSGAPLITAVTSITPKTLVSGAQGFGGQDPSLLPKLDGKVLVIKDFTTILDMPHNQRDEIFGQLRDIYDGETNFAWGTGQLKPYKSLFGILGGVTPVIELHGSANSMLGERFLKCRMPYDNRIKSGDRLLRKTIGNIGKETGMHKELRAISQQVINISVDPHNPPEIPERIVTKLIRLAQWVAAMRGGVHRERYTKVVEFKPTQEVPTRLAKQLARLGMGMAIYHGHMKVTEKEYQMVVSVARGTVPDIVEEIVKQLYLNSREDFVLTKQIAKWCRFPDSTIREKLQDLELLRIITREKTEKGFPKWRLSRTVLRLMREIDLYQKDVMWANAKGGNNGGKKKRKIKKRKA